MSHPADDIMNDVRFLLAHHIVPHKKILEHTMIALIDVMDSDDRAEFVRLMQKWLASS